MDATTTALLESWDRQAEIISRLADAVDDELLPAKPSDDGWTIAFHLCHMHEVRYWWLSQVSKEHVEEIGDLFIAQAGNEDDWVPTKDLGLIRSELKVSAKAVRTAMEHLLESGAGKVGPYSNPVFFMQHMIWHEGYHWALIALAMRRAGRGLAEDWEDKNCWDIWKS